MRLTKALATTALASCLLAVPALAQDAEPLAILPGFEKAADAGEATLNASARLVSGPGVTDGSRALEITFEPEMRSQYAVDADGLWDWSNKGELNLAFDVTNPMDHSFQFFFVTEDEDGKYYQHSGVVPAGETVSFYALINGRAAHGERGMRDTPPAWFSHDQKLAWRNGDRSLDVAKVRRLLFRTYEQLEENRIIVDNLRLRRNPAEDPDYLVGIVDRYGQSARENYPYKIGSDEDLLAARDRELASLSASSGPTGRSKWGGWASGPKFDAAGYFRTVKHEGKWWLVDPDGHLFFSSGIANVRMANLSTVTGYDFVDPSVRAKDAEGLTPDDSKTGTPVSQEARRTRFLASPLRSQMFEWLPSYEEPLGKHYGYRQSFHTSVIEHGETFSFYKANLERKYGEGHLDKWRDVTIDRMRDWGMTSFGNWIDPGYYQKDRIPYFANGWIIGNFDVVYSGQDYWSPLPDFYDPEFARRARLTIEQIAREVENSPWCIGVFVDNEKGWGSMETDRSRFGAVFYTLNRSAGEQPAKAAFTKLLRDKHGSIGALNSAWGTSFASWDAFEQPFEMGELNEASRADFSMLYYDFADTYFRIVHDELERAMPNHMYMGVRIAANWGMPREVVEASKKYSDVMSFNNYREGLHPETWKILEELDKPALIGEYHIGSTSDTGLYHPGLVIAADQTDRGRMYIDYMTTVLENPYMVGAHWFQYVDDYPTGRAYDGENYNVGWVTNTDIPYGPMVEAAKRFNYGLYERRAAVPERTK